MLSSVASVNGAIEPTALEEAAEDDFGVLCNAVEESPLPMALFDMTARRILALSSTARQQFGLGRVDIQTFDIVESSANPDAVRRLVSTILEHDLMEWRWRSLLYTPDGEQCHGTAIGRVVGSIKSRAMCLVRYYLPSSDDELADEYDAARLLEPSFGEAASSDPSGEHRRLAERATLLQQHLARIAHEVEAAGVVTVLAAPELAAVPGLTDLSPRQWEVVHRLVAGERVPTIARAMFLSPSTVRNHLASIYRKVGVNSQAELLERVRESSRAPRPRPVRHFR